MTNVPAIVVGDVTVLALRDAVVDYPWPLAELFPGVPADAWDPYRERYPGAFGDGPSVFRSTYRCYLLRSEGRTLLVDTGAGPASSPLSAAWGLDGALMDALEEAGVAAQDVDASSSRTFIPITSAATCATARSRSRAPTTRCPKPTGRRSTRPRCKRTSRSPMSRRRSRRWSGSGRSSWSRARRRSRVR